MRYICFVKKCQKLEASEALFKKHQKVWEAVKLRKKLCYGLLVSELEIRTQEV